MDVAIWCWVGVDGDALVIILVFNSLEETLISRMITSTHNGNHDNFWTQEAWRFLIDFKGKEGQWTHELAVV